MSVDFTCGDPAGLAGYLYDECDAGERAAIDAHLAVCPSCVSELTALGATRTALASWTPPEATLGFTIRPADGADAPQRERGRVLHAVDRAPLGARWWQQPLPAWAQAAAAVLVFAVGLVVGMRTPAAPAPASRAANPGIAAAAPSVSPDDLAALEARLRAEMSARSATRAAAPAPASDDAVMQRVRALLTESEERQERQLAVRLAQVLRDVDTQRRVDLMRIEQTFGQMEGFMRPELANQRQMINYMFQRTGAQRSPQ
jgi:anti-sigma factor RsiW